VLFAEAKVPKYKISLILLGKKLSGWRWTVILNLIVPMFLGWPTLMDNVLTVAIIDR
jgi:hypothetical protein